MQKCKYYSESAIEMYTPECTGDDWAVHPTDIDGDYCQFCGKKIKFKDNTKVPDELLQQEY
jgi:hypothetical protein